MEWRGYGRALYLRHADGRTTVYGHLERYEDAVLHLERQVARRCAQAGTRYPGDIYLDPPVRVTRGQVIAYSGESGVGLPHLHFEVRDAADAPINPFAAGLPRPADTRPPVLESLVVTAASAAAFVDGERRETTCALRRGADGAYRSEPPVRVAGPVLFVLGAYDPAGDSGRAGIGSLDVAVDGVSLYRFAPRSFRFDQYPEAGLLFDHRYSRLGRAAFAYRLYRLPGNDLARGPATVPDAASEAYPGAADLDPGVHLLEIRVADFAGNTARARVCVQVADTRSEAASVWESGADDPTLRYRLPDVTRTARRPIPAGCAPPPAARVEAETWSPQETRFRPLICGKEPGTCAPAPGDPALDAHSVVRVRDVISGAPGPWRLLPRAPARSIDKDAVTTRVDAWAGFLDVLASVPSLPAPPLSLAAGLRHDPLVPMTYRGEQAYGAALPWQRASGLAPFAIVGDGEPSASLVLDVRWVERGQTLEYAGPGFTLRLPERARFFSGGLAVRTERIAGTATLPSIADAVEILPAGEALDERASLSFDVTPDAVPAPALGIYRWDEFRQSWSYEGGELEPEASRLTLKFRRYGRFALLQDASPPDLREVRPLPGARVTTRRPAITARVEDEGKGLNFDGVAFEIDGVSVASEFDPDRGLSRVLDLQPLATGTHHLKVVATDLAGNVSRVVEQDFEIANR